MKGRRCDIAGPGSTAVTVGNGATFGLPRSHQINEPGPFALLLRYCGSLRKLSQELAILLVHQPENVVVFEFMLGGKKKLELIRELLEQRMMDEGYTDMEFKLHIKQMGNLQLLSTPEANLVTIIQTVLRMQKSGALLVTILKTIEDQRKPLGQDPAEFYDILQIAGDVRTSGDAFVFYCKYRMDVETGGIMSEDQFIRAMEQAMPVLTEIT